MFIGSSALSPHVGGKGGVWLMSSWRGDDGGDMISNISSVSPLTSHHGNAPSQAAIYTHNMSNFDDAWQEEIYLSFNITNKYIPKYKRFILTSNNLFWQEKTLLC